MFHLVNLLHFYQPPTQDPDILKKIAEECYRPVSRVLKETPRLKAAVNICGCLTEMLAKHGFEDVIENLAEAAKLGKVELVTSAAFHAILPLVPYEEAKRQVTLNNQINKHYFGDAWEPKGIFPPEMCYGEQVARLCQELGIKYIFLDNVAYSADLDIPAPGDRLYKIRGYDVYVFFRHRRVSDIVGFRGPGSKGDFFRYISKYIPPSGHYLFLATDGEVYGHHHTQTLNFLREIALDPNVAPALPWEVFLMFEEKPPDVVEPIPSSWASSSEEVRGGIPYGLWKHPDNPIHAKQWELAKLVVEVVREAGQSRDPGFEKARRILDRALHSCQFWWASARPWWGPAMIEKGLKLWIEAVRALKHPDEEKVKLAESIALWIRETVEKWEREKTAEERQKAYFMEKEAVPSMLKFGRKPG